MYMYSLIMTSQHMHHTLGFSAAITAALWRARELQQKLLFAEPRGLEETCDAVLHVHQLVVYTPNKRMQSRKTFFQMFERYAPAMAYFLLLGTQCVHVRGKIRKQ